VDHIYTITDRDKENFSTDFLNNYSGDLRVFGNTRYDQVIERAKNAAGKNLLPESFRSSVVFAGGSVWPEDNKVILKPLGSLTAEYPDLKFVFAPHEPTQKHLDELIQWCEHNDLDCALFSALSHAEENIRVILVDVIGQLAEIYHDCDIAFVGGAFTGSVHNVMEPAVARCTVLYGPDHQNSDEAAQLIEAKGGFSISDSEQFQTKMENFLSEKSVLQEAREKAAQVILKNAGATEKTVQAILGSES
jgi:3-deoxy-D-manno-octulosonic-acid transferase